MTTLKISLLLCNLDVFNISETWQSEDKSGHLVGFFNGKRSSSQEVYLRTLAMEVELSEMQ